MAERDVRYFRDIPWCAAILDDPAWQTTETPCRHHKTSTEDALLSDTLNTPSTIPACLTLYRIAAPTDVRITDSKTLFALGNGINGHPHICHGGIVATLLDEAMGILQAVNKDRDEEMAAARGSVVERPAEFTAELVVKYLKPLRTPGSVCVDVSFEKVEGRKLWLKAAIKDEAGLVLATGESLFIQVRKDRL